MTTRPDEQSLLELFAQIVPEERWREHEAGARAAQIYSLPVVVEMLLLQRLQERGTQQEAVHQVVTGRLNRLLPDGKRVREGRISQNTGGYARACGRIAVGVIEQICDAVLGELGKRIEPEASMDRAVMLFDGSSLSLEHAPGLLEAFPPAHNQHGLGHWGILKWVSLHDMRTGIALRPAWGPMYGPEAVSEQQLAEQVLQRAPAGSVIVGDGNFGIFAFAYAVVQSHREAIFRLSKLRAQALGGPDLVPHGEQSVRWVPSRRDREKYPGLGEEARVEGRLLVLTRNGFRDPLYLFTTLSEPAERIVAWYSQRWKIELDLRTLKGTMRLRHLRGKSTAAVEKELLIAVVAYGLVRAFMALAARRAGQPPRALSFTRCYGLLNAMMAAMCSVDQTQRQPAYARILDYMAQAKLPQRSKPRSYPRAVWLSGKHYPIRRAQQIERKSK